MSKNKIQTKSFSFSIKEKRIGDYQILSKLGKGATGEVFKARNVANKQLVAVKVFYSHDLNQELLQRFLQEVQICMEMEHPKIVKVYEFGMFRNRPIIIMEYVQGCSLQDYVNEHNRFSPSQALRVVAQVAHGLHYAHKRGIIHRDLKPSNVLLRKTDQTIKIIDFGSMKVLNNAITPAYQMLGTIHYIPPEQIDDARTVDLTADIYSLGALLYFLLSGKPPYFHVKGLEALMFNISQEKPLPLTQLVTVAQCVISIVNKAMASSPEDRYQSTETLFEDIVQALKELKKIRPDDEA